MEPHLAGLQLQAGAAVQIGGLGRLPGTCALAVHDELHHVLDARPLHQALTNCHRAVGHQCDLRTTGTGGIIPDLKASTFKWIESY